MKAIIENDKITIVDPDALTKARLKEALSFTDKSKQYQLRRLGKSPFNRKSDFYKKLQSEVYGTLLKEQSCGSLEIPSGFSHIISNIDHEDRRVINGDDIGLPWKNKPF